MSLRMGPETESTLIKNKPSGQLWQEAGLSLEGLSAFGKLLNEAGSFEKLPPDRYKDLAAAFKPLYLGIPGIQNYTNLVLDASGIPFSAYEAIAAGQDNQCLGKFTDIVHRIMFNTVQRNIGLLF